MARDTERKRLFQEGRKGNRKKMDREKSGTGEMKCPIEAFDCEKNMKRVNCELCHFHVPCVHLESHLPVSSVFLAMFLKHQHQLPRYMIWSILEKRKGSTMKIKVVGGQFVLPEHSHQEGIIQRIDSCNFNLFQWLLSAFRHCFEYWTPLASFTMSDY